MSQYTVSIEEAPRGAYNKVKSALAGLDPVYTKENKTFSFEADTDQAAAAGAEIILFDVALADQIAKQLPRKTAPVADPKPEPVAPVPSLAVVPAPASWSVEVRVPRLGGSSTLTIVASECPDPQRYGAKLGGDRCIIKDAKGTVVASWP